jgi:hypothetical protein
MFLWFDASTTSVLLNIAPMCITVIKEEKWNRSGSLLSITAYLMIQNSRVEYTLVLVLELFMATPRRKGGDARTAMIYAKQGVAPIQVLF